MRATGLPLLDAIAADQALEEALNRVKNNNEQWMALALVQLRQFALSHDAWANTEHGITGEDIRFMLLPHIGHPTTPKAWGALIGAAIKQGIIEATGAYRKMKDVRSHSRKTPVYRFMGAT
jgi:hypothetical protein